MNSTAAMRDPSGDRAGAKSRVLFVRKRLFPEARSQDTTTDQLRSPQRGSGTLSDQTARPPATDIAV